MIAIFARDKDIAESFGCAFTPLHPLRTSPGLEDTAAFFNSSWLETWTTKATWLLSNPPCPDASARPDLNLKHGTIVRERRGGRGTGSEAVEQWPYVGLGSAAGGSIGEYFIRAWAKFFPNENIHISPKVRPRHMGMFINTAACVWSSDIDNSFVYFFLLLNLKLEDSTKG